LNLYPVAFAILAIKKGSGYFVRHSIIKWVLHCNGRNPTLFGYCLCQSILTLLWTLILTNIDQAMFEGGTLKNKRRSWHKNSV
jgi:hypothetical protein